MARRASPIVVVLVTCPSPSQARRLARALIARRAAACVNVLPGVTSWFRWQGKVQRAREALLIIKTTTRGFEPLRALIRSLHPYEVPEIVALPVTAAHRPYQQWVAASLRPSAGSSMP